MRCGRRSSGRSPSYRRRWRHPRSRRRTRSGASDPPCANCLGASDPPCANCPGSSPTLPLHPAGRGRQGGDRKVPPDLRGVWKRKEAKMPESMTFSNLFRWSSSLLVPCALFKQQTVLVRTEVGRSRGRGRLVRVQADHGLRVLEVLDALGGQAGARGTRTTRP